MSGGGLLLVGLAMAVGLAGTVVPVLPGLPVIWVAGLVWAVAVGGPAAWLVLGTLTLLFAGGTAAHYVLPARSLPDAPRSVLLLGLAGAVVGMVVVPVVGFAAGGFAAVFLAELRRTGDRAAALASTRRVLLAFGKGMLIEIGAGVLMVLTWLAGVLAT